MKAPESTIASRLAVAKRRLARQLAEDGVANERGQQAIIESRVR